MAASSFVYIFADIFLWHMCHSTVLYQLRSVTLFSTFFMVIGCYSLFGSKGSLAWRAELFCVISKII